MDSATTFRQKTDLFASEHKPKQGKREWKGEGEGEGEGKKGKIGKIGEKMENGGKKKKEGTGV